MFSHSNNFSFAPLKKSQEQLVLRWLQKLHVEMWYHSQGLQNTIQGIYVFLYANTLRFDTWVGHLDHDPFAFLMTFKLDLKTDTEPHLQKWLRDGESAISLDLLIGEEKYLGQGLSSPLINAFIDKFFPHIDTIFIDPESKHTHAIHVYKKAGFVMVDTFTASWNPVPHVLMRLSRTS